MSDSFDPSAVPAPAAAPSQAIPEAHAPIPAATTPVPQGAAAPAGPGAPAVSEPTPEAPASPDPAEIERWKAAAAERDQLRADMAREKAEREALIQQQRQYTEQQQRDQAAQQYMAQAYDYASRLDTDEERASYIARAAYNLQLQEREYAQQQAQQQISQYQAREQAAYLQQYPQWLKQQFGLDDATVEMISQYDDPKVMTVAAQQAQRYNQQLAELRKLTDQAYAQQQHNALRSSGVASMGGMNASPTGMPRITPEMSESERDARFLRAIGMTS